MIKKLKERLLDIVSHSILDGQNQIHDLRDEKATPKDIDKRMFKSLEFHSTAINKVILEVLEEIDDKVKNSLHVIIEKDEHTFISQRDLLNHIQELKKQYK